VSSTKKGDRKLPTRRGKRTKGCGQALNHPTIKDCKGNKAGEYKKSKFCKEQPKQGKISHNPSQQQWGKEKIERALGGKKQERMGHATGFTQNRRKHRSINTLKRLKTTKVLRGKGG